MQRREGNTKRAPVDRKSISLQPPLLLCLPQQTIRFMTKRIRWTWCHPRWSMQLATDGVIVLVFVKNGWASSLAGSSFLCCGLSEYCYWSWWAIRNLWTLLHPSPPFHHSHFSRGRVKCYVVPLGFIYANFRAPLKTNGMPLNGLWRFSESNVWTAAALVGSSGCSIILFAPRRRRI